MSNGYLNREPFYYRSLTRNVAAIIIMVSFTPLILVSGIILNQFSKSYHEKASAHLEVLIRKHKQNIDSFLKEKLGDIRFISQSYSYEELISPGVLERQLEKLRQDFGSVFEDMGVIDDHGNQMAYAGPHPLNKARYSDADWFKNAVQHQSFISDVFHGLRGLPHFIVSVRGEQNGKFWLLRATIDFVAFNSLVENLRVGKTGFAFIINKDGAFQTRPMMDALPSEELQMFGTVDVNYLTNFFKSGKKTKDDVYLVEKKDKSGKKILYVGAFLKDGDWVLVFQQEADDALSDLGNAQKAALTIVVIGGICIVTTAILLSRQIVDRIAAADKEKELLNRQVIEAGRLMSIGELAAGVAHEINNPVGIMLQQVGWIQDLLEEEEFVESENLKEIQETLKQIHIQGQRCKEITHSLLSFARKTDPKAQEFQVNDLIREVVKLSLQRARHANILIHTNLSQDLPVIKMSQTELQQVMLNLINNAVDAMEHRGGTIKISTRHEGNNIFVEVADDGPGIPEEYLSKVFDPFFTTKPVGKGTGLGLAICYGIIRKLDGDIRVESKVGYGTTFYIRIPKEPSLERNDFDPDRALTALNM